MNWFSVQMNAPIIAGVVSLNIGLTIVLVAAILSNKKMRQDLKLEFAAEGVAREMLLDHKLPYRASRVLKYHLSGFTDDELRKVLVRAGQSEGIESHVVDAASILTSRRRRRAKTDRIDGETLVRTLLAYKRGEPRVCSMVKAPTPEEEDRRRICRERKTLVAERVEHVNRIKGLLFAQGVFDYEPLKRNRRARLEELKTGDGRLLPAHLKAQISRELDRLELVL